MRARRAAPTALAALVLLGGSAAEEETEASCRAPGERYQEPAISVAEAREREGELVSVRGALIAPDGRPALLCTRVDDARPPSCSPPSLRFEGVRDLSAFESQSIESAGNVAWTGSVHVAGRVDGDTLRFELSCRTRRIQERFEDETGETLTFNAFLSNAEVERIDLAPLPELMPADARARYGWFGVSVKVDDRGEPIFADEVGADGRGVFWLQERDGWIAIKRYGRNVALLWIAGNAKRLDERWRRLDEAMRDVTAAARAGG